MSAISNLVRRFTGGRGGAAPAARRPGPTGGATGGGRSTDEAIGRGVRTAVSKLRRRR